MQKQNEPQPNTLKKGKWILVEDNGFTSGRFNCLIHTSSIEKVAQGGKCLFVNTHSGHFYKYPSKNLKKFQTLLNNFEE